MTALSGYAFATLREGDLNLSRGAGDGLAPILLVAPLAEQPALESLRRLEHEYALRGELGAGWATSRKSAGMIAVKVEPAPSRLSTRIVPPRRPASLRDNGRPRPVLR